MPVFSEGSAIPAEPTSVLPSSVPAITPTITGKSSALYLCTKMLNYLLVSNPLFPLLASSIGPEGELVIFVNLHLPYK